VSFAYWCCAQRAETAAARAAVVILVGARVVLTRRAEYATATWHPRLRRTVEVAAFRSYTII